MTGVASPSLVHAQSWTFGAPPSAGDAWTAERGTLTLGDGEARLQLDSNRRVVLLSPPGLPESVRTAEKFVLQIAGSGLQRVRIQARRDARGGWIKIAAARGSPLLATAGAPRWARGMDHDRRCERLVAAVNGERLRDQTQVRRARRCH